MPEYQVTVLREELLQGVINVTADSESEAEDEAESRLANLGWYMACDQDNREFLEGSTSITSVEEI